jgi:replication fork protection complex subunit Tof1/Swi1
VRIRFDRGCFLRHLFHANERVCQAFFPKNRGTWKAFSSWEPPEKNVRALREKPGAGEVQVKRGFSWSEQLGIVVAALVEADQRKLVDWTKDVSVVVAGLPRTLILRAIRDSCDGDTAMGTDRGGGGGSGEGGQHEGGG